LPRSPLPAGCTATQARDVFCHPEPHVTLQDPVATKVYWKVKTLGLALGLGRWGALVEERRASPSRSAGPGLVLGLNLGLALGPALALALEPVRGPALADAPLVLGPLPPSPSDRVLALAVALLHRDALMGGAEEPGAAGRGEVLVAPAVPPPGP
jgi:hypothetical protein